MSDLILSPKLEQHCGIHVVRDDLLPGGTKTRIFRDLMSRSQATEFVYAGPGFGAAQIALAVVAYQYCRQATLFVPWRRERTAYTKAAADFGAKIVEVRPGYLSVLQKRARHYAEERGAELVPFGGGQTSEAITEAALGLRVSPREVWCAAGSGTLARSLRKAWPKAELHVVQVGRSLQAIAGAHTHKAGCTFESPIRSSAPFPTHRHYEAKAWHLLTAERRRDNVLFWNVHG